MKKIFCFILNILLLFQTSNVSSKESFNRVKKRELKKLNTLIENTTKIEIPGYPQAFNPSIIEDGDGYILTFREAVRNALYLTWIGVVKLDKNFKVISTPVLLDPRIHSSDPDPVPSQSEDARLIRHQGKLFLVYSDNDIQVAPGRTKRDMYIAELIETEESFAIGEPELLSYPEKHDVPFQKNWSPFVEKDNLNFIYYIKPHEILSYTPGEALKLKAKTDTKVNWSWGELRGGTPALLVDDEYLTFFHTCKPLRTQASNFKTRLHYFMGAYTFSKEYPYNVTKMTKAPIIAKEFYSNKSDYLRVVFPCGFVVDGENIHVAYGKDDHEVWIATMKKSKLKEVLHPVPN